VVEDRALHYSASHGNYYNRQNVLSKRYTFDEFYCVFCWFVSCYPVSFIVVFYCFMTQWIIETWTSTVNPRGSNKSGTQSQSHSCDRRCDLEAPECTKSYDRRDFAPDTAGEERCQTPSWCEEFTTPSDLRASPVPPNGGCQPIWNYLEPPLIADK